MRHVTSLPVDSESHQTHLTLRGCTRGATDSRAECKTREPLCGPLLLGSRGAHFDAADHGPCGNSQHHGSRFGNVFGRNHPASVALPLGGISAKLGIDATGKNGTDADVVVTVIEHKGLREE